MRFFEIVVLSVAAGLIVTAFLVFPEISAAPGSLMPLVMARWPELAIDWASAYGLAAVLLVAGALPPIVPWWRRGHRAVPISPSGRGSTLKRYMIGLGIVQFYTAVIGLLVLGSWRFVIEEAPLSGTSIIGSAGLRGGLGLVLAAVFAGLAVAGAAERRRDQGLGPSSETAELRLLRQIDQRLIAQSSLAASERDERGEQLKVTIEAGQQQVLEAAKNLTTAVNRLGRGLKRALGEIKDAMPPQGEGWRGAGAGAPSTEGVTSELWAAVGVLSESVAKLSDLTPATSQRDMPASLAQLSSELDTLLHEIDRDWEEDVPQS